MAFWITTMLAILDNLNFFYIFQLPSFPDRLKHNLMQHELENNSRLKKKINNAVTPILQKRRSLVRAVASAAAVGGKRMMQVSTLAHLF